jgi:hypothetical protein
MVEFRFPAAFLARAMDSETSRAKIKALGAELGWPANGRTPPSVKWLASQTDNSDLYDFLYSATSRVLHFSVSEIARRGWGPNVAWQ